MPAPSHRPRPYGSWPVGGPTVMQSMQPLFGGGGGGGGNGHVPSDPPSGFCTPVHVDVDVPSEFVVTINPMWQDGLEHEFLWVFPF